MPRIRAGSIAAHKEATRRQLLAAASDLFRAQGYGATHLADIAAHAGIGRTTVYEYFTDKEDVLVNLVEAEVPTVVAGMLSGLPDDLGDRERLAELIQRGLAFVSTDHALGSMVMRELPALSPEAAARIRAVHAPIEHEIVRLCRHGIASEEFRAFDPVDAARLVYGVMMAASQTLLRDSNAKQRMHEAADTLVRFVFDGLSA
jgi:AcrR family transcriptional regulator